MPRADLSSHGSGGLVTVPGLAGRSVFVAVEDVRHSIVEYDIADHVGQSNDHMDISFDAVLNSLIVTDS